MCLGIPGRIVELEADGDLAMGKVEFGGVSKRVCLEYVRDAQPGDWVLVHVGFALSLIDEAEARRIFELLEELGGLEELNEGEPPEPPEPLRAEAPVLAGEAPVTVTESPRGGE